MKERIQKVLAAAGVASRRDAERLVLDGRVRVNGRVVRELGTKVDGHADRIEVDGRRVVRERLAYYVLHKPRGVVTTARDPQGRPTVAELAASLPERVFAVGRLDFHTSGALLLTNDGELSEALLRPRARVPKVYAAKVRGHVSVASLDVLRNGVVLDDGTRTRAAEVMVIREDELHTWLRLTLFEGKNRQVHRMGMAVGHPVLRLVRVSFAGIDTQGLRPGRMRPLDAKEVEQLKRRYVAAARRAKRPPPASDPAAEH